jgi:hypothetical protein
LKPELEATSGAVAVEGYGHIQRARACEVRKCTLVHVYMLLLSKKYILKY